MKKKIRLLESQLLDIKTQLDKKRNKCKHKYKTILLADGCNGSECIECGYIWG